MKPELSLVAAGHATSLFLMISFTLCVAFDLLFPEHAMYQAWCNYCRDLNGSVGRVLSWDWRKVMVTAGISCLSGFASITRSLPGVKSAERSHGHDQNRGKPSFLLVWETVLLESETPLGISIRTRPARGAKS
jgi:hypothetical protein